MKNSFSIYLFAFAAIFFFSCNEEGEEDEELNPNVNINNWIYATMNYYYYWNIEMPLSYDAQLDPLDFYETILSNQDRFSIIRPDYQELLDFLNGTRFEAGYDFQWIEDTETAQNLLVITYVKDNSPAHQAGLLRGDQITHINGIEITADNIRDLVSSITDLHSITYERLIDGVFETQPELSLTTIPLEENPNYLDTIYEVNGRKVGYFVYNYFPKDSSSSPYTIELHDVFRNFKENGITDLVADFRYNSGGFVNTATTLASLIVADATEEDVFFESEFNDFYGTYLESIAGEQYFFQRFQEKNENIGSMINNQVYVLTGPNTASASELVINGLSAYMNVTLIGGQTVGKNVGSTLLGDRYNEANNYALLPIVVRHTNSLGISEFENGFVPDAANRINEFLEPLTPLGDLNEPLLARAIELISGLPAKKLTKKGRRVQVKKSLKDFYGTSQIMIESGLPFDLSDR